MRKRRRTPDNRPRWFDLGDEPPATDSVETMWMMDAMPSSFRKLARKYGLVPTYTLFEESDDPGIAEMALEMRRQKRQRDWLGTDHIPKPAGLPANRGSVVR